MSGRQQPPTSPVALRLRRPGWRDRRLLLGVVLVAASVALCSTLVSSAGRTVAVYAAGDVLVPGDVVEPGALRVRNVRLDAAEGAYLHADEMLPEGLMVTRTVGAGELVPRGAVAEEADLGLRPVAIEPEGALPGELGAGSTVDLWYVPESASGTGASGTASGTVASGTAASTGPASGAMEPTLLAAGLTVAEVSEPRAGLSVASAVTVHVLLPVDDLPRVLSALAADGSVEVVLVPGSDG